ncbi:hypothetical protein WMF45_03960 [Sorangium sp. So ce448]|uniref:hypothetical protein n=1 Tax=Sorangium sp. So ce448 TaxID=3133314 RepID=UPI003F618D3A
MPRSRCRTIFFRFAPSSTSKRIAEILTELRAMANVLDVGRLFPDEDGDLNYYACIATSSDAESVVAHLARLSEIKDAELQPNYRYSP